MKLPLPVLETEFALADWLCLSQSELQWFADLKGISTSHPLEHYRYTILQKRTGGIRLIEAPKAKLKLLQQRILTGILEHIPTHPAVHGFVKGRSTKTFAAPHTGQPTVLRMDLDNFFPSVRRHRVAGFFRLLGYTEGVALMLSGLCTNATPGRVLAAHPDERFLYASPHLPQGAPTSPMLANLCVYRADCRLAMLASKSGAAYTRYADDLAFSPVDNPRFASYVAMILSEEGFAVNHRKSRYMGHGSRQHLAGIVVNGGLGVPRDEFDALKATLTNCARQGLDSQNRDGHPNFFAHLTGRVTYIESIHAVRGAKLRAILNRIAMP